MVKRSTTLQWLHSTVLVVILLCAQGALQQCKHTKIGENIPFRNIDQACESQNITNLQVDVPEVTTIHTDKAITSTLCSNDTVGAYIHEDGDSLCLTSIDNFTTNICPCTIMRVTGVKIYAKVLDETNATASTNTTSNISSSLNVSNASTVPGSGNFAEFQYEKLEQKLLDIKGRALYTLSEEKFCVKDPSPGCLGTCAGRDAERAYNYDAPGCACPLPARRQKDGYCNMPCEDNSFSCTDDDKCRKLHKGDSCNVLIFYPLLRDLPQGKVSMQSRGISNTDIYPVTLMQSWGVQYDKSQYDNWGRQADNLAVYDASTMVFVQHPEESDKPFAHFYKTELSLELIQSVIILTIGVCVAMVVLIYDTVLKRFSIRQPDWRHKTPDEYLWQAPLYCARHTCKGPKMCECFYRNCLKQEKDLNTPKGGTAAFMLFLVAVGIYYLRFQAPALIQRGIKSVTLRRPIMINITGECQIGWHLKALCNDSLSYTKNGLTARALLDPVKEDEEATAYTIVDQALAICLFVFFPSFAVLVLVCLCCPQREEDKSCWICTKDEVDHYSKMQDEQHQLFAQQELGGQSTGISNKDAEVLNKQVGTQEKKDPTPSNDIDIQEQQDQTPSKLAETQKQQSQTLNKEAETSKSKKAASVHGDIVVVTSAPSLVNSFMLRSAPSPDKVQGPEDSV